MYMGYFTDLITYLKFSERRNSTQIIIIMEIWVEATVSTISPSICHEVMGSDAMILVFSTNFKYHVLS